MKPKQYYEFGKFFIGIGQIVAGARAVSYFIAGGNVSVASLLASFIVVAVCLAVGLYLIGKGE